MKELKHFRVWFNLALVVIFLHGGMTTERPKAAFLYGIVVVVAILNALVFWVWLSKEGRIQESRKPFGVHPK